MASRAARRLDGMGTKANAGVGARVAGRRGTGIAGGKRGVREGARAGKRVGRVFCVERVACHGGVEVGVEWAGRFWQE